ncbi:synaptic vesicle glycoprotein 2B-like isoform X1 [Microplitis mediator]|uniref:synaptic vesicle glycoprotein 2B-like isoform X1 n=2 Tax=Microplitis mediator TaxID=375433 RepID=UPI0025561B24|nr:synaptic vesicle glycoprotein 2B-like isoform X1 [Microplitis mediator]XP_057333189.1 synaptic vesicle glycoprotein 2B-like isoform X1 [Microplitis mediator]XP_057333190.1 synaptic vesicle glycoprotein 2B-like isoform X1 [Microplitis mediator]XP_057333191.1 synaptic vesicle glycoprotein 2B-like isoform X1 [Microplitis mediator]
MMEASRIDEQVVQDALNETGFGKFSYKMLIIVTLISINTGISFENVSFVMPAAVCDFKMSTIAQDRIAISSLFGLALGPYFWACMAETKGRKVSLIIGLLLDGCSNALASVISNYYGFVICKFFNGVGIGSQFTVLFTYIGEFQPDNYRDKVLSWLELPFILGAILNAGIGWIIIPLKFSYISETTFFFFNPWNLYILICAIVALIAAFCLTFLPETPKYLAETGQYTKLMGVLCQMHHENTGQSDINYIERLEQLHNPGINDLLSKVKLTNNICEYKPTFIKKFIKFIKQVKEIMKPPYLNRTLIICVSMYGTSYSLFVTMLWIPEIFERFAMFEEKYPNMTASVCLVSEKLHSKDAMLKNNINFDDCPSKLDYTVYSQTIIVCLAAIPAGVWLPLFIDRLGYKFHFILATSVTSLLYIGLLLVKSSAQNFIVSCVIDGLSFGANVIYYMLVNLYPTHLRVIASNLVAFVGYIGGTVSIIVVGYLVDDHCLILIIIISAHVGVAAIFGFFIPTSQPT